MILKFAKRWKPLRTGLESNGYQAAQAEVSEETSVMRKIEVNLRKRETDTDKISRAWKLSPKFESKRVFFVKNRTEPCRDQLVMFPSMKLKDLFDALDHAVWASKQRRRRVRREPGVF
jgi:phage terminase large subunit-like protein